MATVSQPQRQQHQLSDVVARAARGDRRPRARPVAARSTAYTRTEPQPLRRTPEPEADRADLDSIARCPIAPRRPQPAAPRAGGRRCRRRLAALPAAARAAGVPRGRARIAGRDAACRGRPSEPGQPGSTSSGFSASKLFAIDVEEFAHDPELEEASIRFANGDDAGAEAGLMEVLGAAGRARATTTRPG